MKSCKLYSFIFEKSQRDNKIPNHGRIVVIITIPSKFL